jgi:hypothetical protein
MSDLVVIFLSSIVVLRVLTTNWRLLSCATIAFSERCKAKTVCVLAMKACGRVEVQLRSFFTSAPDESEWINLPPNCYTAGEKRVFVPTEWGLCEPQKTV